jgi:purine-cytosine permease-like protein
VKLFGATDSQGLRIGLYALIGLIVIVVVVFGYQFMLFVNRIAVWLNTALMLLAIVAFAGVFHADFAGAPDQLALGGFWPTFILSALIAMSNPISFGAFLGDWARYIPNGTSNA